MIPIRIEDDDQRRQGDLRLHRQFIRPIGSILQFGIRRATFSAVAAGMKTFFPDLPLNSGFYRCFEIIASEGSIVDARWPIACHRAS